MGSRVSDVDRSLHFIMRSMSLMVSGAPDVDNSLRLHLVTEKPHSFCKSTLLNLRVFTSHDVSTSWSQGSLRLIDLLR